MRNYGLYGRFDGDPCIIRDQDGYRDAWIFYKGWKPVDWTEARYKAGKLTKEEFESLYPNLPPLPTPSET